MNWDPETIKLNLLLLAGLMVIVAGIVIIAKSRNGEVREGAAIGAGIIIAALVIAIGSHLQEVGDWLYGIIF